MTNNEKLALELIKFKESDLGYALFEASELNDEKQKVKNTKEDTIALIEDLNQDAKDKLVKYSKNFLDNENDYYFVTLNQIHKNKQKDPLNNLRGALAKEVLQKFLNNEISEHAMIHSIGFVTHGNEIELSKFEESLDESLQSPSKFVTTCTFQDDMNIRLDKFRTLKTPYVFKPDTKKHRLKIIGFLKRKGYLGKSPHNFDVLNLTDDEFYIFKTIMNGENKLYYESR